MTLATEKPGQWMRLALVCAACLLWICTSAAASEANAPAPSENDFSKYAPPLLTREMWKARPALEGMIPHIPKGVIVHHTGAAQKPALSLASKMQSLQTFSQKHLHPSPGGKQTTWPDVPYHFYIDAHGAVAEGRDPRFAGDTNTRYDTRGYIQIVLEGDFEKEKPSQKQLNTLQQMLVWQSLVWSLPSGQISVHKDHASTSCPGSNLLSVLPGLMKRSAAQQADAIAEICAKDSGAKMDPAFCKREQ